MIVVCEPQCKELSHEKVNSGFIYGLRLAFPDQKIVLYADASHISVLQSVLLLDGINIENIEYKTISFELTDTFSAFMRYYFLFRKLLAEVIAGGEDKLFMLSFSPKILYILKRLKSKRIFSKLKFTLVLHGDFENIATDQVQSLLMPVVAPAAGKKKLSDRLKKITPAKIINISFNLLRAKFENLSRKPGQSFNRQFPTTKMLLWKASDDFRYLALSPHVLENAKKYLDIKKVPIKAVVLPTVFAKPAQAPENNYVRFGVFGFGNPLMLREIALRLAKKGIEKPYEIRIIGMDNNGLEQFPNITCPRPGKRLPRAEMESNAAEMDMFLILYDSSRYRLSCSGSILESLSYMKPVLHFDNECIDFFDRPERPIGISCKSIDAYADRMEDIINNYPIYRDKFDELRKNILLVRQDVGIENHVPVIRNSFTW